MARPIAEHTLDGYVGRMNPRTRMVEFGPPPAVQRFAADDDLRAQIAAMKRQIQAATRRAEVAETQLARLKQSGQMSAPERPAIDPEEIYRQRRQPAGGSPAALYIRRRTQVEGDDPEETAPEPPQASLGMAAEAVYAARRKAAQRFL